MASRVTQPSKDLRVFLSPEVEASVEGLLLAVVWGLNPGVHRRHVRTP